MPESRACLDMGVAGGQAELRKPKIMRAILLMAGICLAAGPLFAGSAEIIKQRAKDVRNQNNARQGVPVAPAGPGGGAVMIRSLMVIYNSRPAAQQGHRDVPDADAAERHQPVPLGGPGEPDAGGEPSTCWRTCSTSTRCRSRTASWSARRPRWRSIAQGGGPIHALPVHGDSRGGLQPQGRRVCHERTEFLSGQEFSGHLSRRSVAQRVLDRGDAP
jgi:hypothetical protein